MVVPPVHAACWRELAEGGLARLETTNLGTLMLKKRMEISNASLTEKARQIHRYYNKWGDGLPDEIAQFGG